MRLAATLLLLTSLFVGSCVRAEPKVDGTWRIATPRLTQEQREALMAVPNKSELPPVPLTLFTTPRGILAYVQMRVTCILPAQADGRYRFSIEGIFAAEGDVNKREISYDFRAGCDKIIAICSYWEYRSPHGYMEPQSKILEIEPVGECR